MRLGLCEGLNAPVVRGSEDPGWLTWEETLREMGEVPDLVGGSVHSVDVSSLSAPRFDRVKLRTVLPTFGSVYVEVSPDRTMWWLFVLKDGAPSALRKGLPPVAWAVVDRTAKVVWVRPDMYNEWEHVADEVCQDGADSGLGRLFPSSWACEADSDAYDHRMVKHPQDVLIDRVYRREWNELFPVLVNRKKIHGRWFLLRRTDGPVGEDHAEGVSVFLPNGLRIGEAMWIPSDRAYEDDEEIVWVAVADQFQGLGLGTWMADELQRMISMSLVGGLSDAGLATARAMWERRVRTLLAAGAYSDAVLRGRVTLQRVREIVSGLRGSKRRGSARVGGARASGFSVADLLQHQRTPLVYVGDDCFVVYDALLISQWRESHRMERAGVYAAGWWEWKYHGTTLALRDLAYLRGFRDTAVRTAVGVAEALGKVFEPYPSWPVAGVSDVSRRGGVWVTRDGSSVWRRRLQQEARWNGGASKERAFAKALCKIANGTWPRVV